MTKNWLCIKKRWISVILCVIAAVSFPTSAFALERYEIIALGDKDKYVLELQEALYKAGYLKQKPTGYFGTDTQNAVISFQKDHGLTIDGKAGSKTRKAILGSAFEEIPAERSASRTQAKNGAQNMPGDKGEEIQKCQQRLKELEYYTYGKITGYYGPMTVLAVKRFQHQNGLPEDGILNAETMELLFAKDAKTYTIYPGEKSENVKKMQERLKELGYYRQDVTGYFGSVTKNALINFQKTNGLTADGKAGTNTRKLLFSNDAQKSTGEMQNAKTVTETALTKAQKMIAIAKKQLGKKYVRGREGPDTFDSSGFVYYVISSMGVHISRVSAEGLSNLTGWAKLTATDSLKPGDVLFWKNSSNSSRIGHTGIYIGGGKFIHASCSNKMVVYGELKGFFENNFAFARRIF